MVHAKEVLANQLLANANDPSWHLPFLQAVEGVTEEEAYWKPAPGSHSIAAITQHLLYWNEIWLTRFKEGRMDAAVAVGDNNHSFVIAENVSFSDLREGLLDVLLQWQDLLSIERLEAPAIGFPVSVVWWEVISNAAIHNAYHIGQIVFIRKLQRDPSR
ncbi:DinB family protein [Paenibacillus sp. P96]|uniref:DinB family protein n=1 Tax=Paenibacillus zeirhizosphaerae TaxID=2987519 RepID=A0ABT9FNM5_9BACL|nr:DinB family protein [Paenibacillus sp. P96]MDP4096338.1 DinB family protein [Paenibacillus sp. P96]